MCIVLLTTLHPAYPLILLNNRDEYILRPTSRPHWWSPTPSPHATSASSPEILSSRDLQRPERGTWLGITRSGSLAVLTNYREAYEVLSARSRGGMVSAWLGADPSQGTEDFVRELVSGDGLAGVGGFSLLCGRLKTEGKGGERGLEGLAVVSNRAQGSEDVPWIGKGKGVWGLSNTYFRDPVKWPKVEMGKELLESAVRDSLDGGDGEEELVQRLWKVLDKDTMPKRQKDEEFEEYLYQLRESIFIPGLNSDDVGHLKAEDIASAGEGNVNGAPEEKMEPNGSGQGLYGTQRQTIILVDWEGRVSFRERALWDEFGKPIPRGAGDMKFEFQAESWNGEPSLL